MYRKVMGRTVVERIVMVRTGGGDNSDGENRGGDNSQ